MRDVLGIPFLLCIMWRFLRGFFANWLSYCSSEGCGPGALAVPFCVQ